MKTYPLPSRFGSPYGLPTTRDKHIWGAVIGGALSLAAGLASSASTRKTSEYASSI